MQGQVERTLARPAICRIDGVSPVGPLLQTEFAIPVSHSWEFAKLNERVRRRYDETAISKDETSNIATKWNQIN